MPARWLHSSLHYLLPDRTATQRSGAVSLLISMSIVAATLVLGGPLLRFDERARIGSTSGTQFEAAINWVFCHRYGGATSYRAENRAVINLAEIRDPRLYSTSVVSMLQEAFGDARDYCRQPYDRPDLSEPTMMLIDAFALRVAPDASLRSLARSFAVARLAAIVVFGWCLLITGFSVSVHRMHGQFRGIPDDAAGRTCVAGTTRSCCQPCCSGFPIGRQVLVAPAFWKSSPGSACSASGRAFSATWRTSHFPLALAVCVFSSCSSIATEIATEIQWRRTLRATSELAVFVLGLWTFHATYIKLVARVADGASYHLIAHPLVLGLATIRIRSPCARRSGGTIPAGDALARKIIPPRPPD